MDKNGKSLEPGGSRIGGKRRPDLNLKPKSTKKKQKLNDSVQRSYTDSDVELFEAACALSPAISGNRSEKAVLLTRYKTAPAVLNSNSNFVRNPAVQGMNYQGNATIDDLPDEILQEVFCQLPAIDLVHYVAPVSRRFNNIICHQNFLQWKKLYARYLRRDETAVHHIESELRNDMADPNQPLGPMELIKFMATVQNLMDHETETALRRLALHPHHQAAIRLVEKAFPDQDAPNLGALVAAMVLISDNVESMSRIVHLLTAQPAFCKTVYSIEYFYCLLTMIQFYSKLGILKNGRHHYQLKYAIYLLENGGKKSHNELAVKAGQGANRGGTGQTSMNMFIGRQERLPTYEQYRIIGHDMQPGDYVRIIAFAGTGKTTTLIEYCRARPNKKFLVIFYNKDVAEDAGSRFPRNAECRTIHSIAFAKFGWKYADRGNLEHGSIKLEAIVDECRKEIIGVDRYVRAALIKETLQNFFASDREDISTELVPDKWEYTNRKGGPEVLILEQDIQLEIVRQTERFWEAMQDVNNGEVRMPHDGYLKLFQLSKPRLWGSKGRRYDALLIDEAQDCNPAALDIFKRQEHLPKMLVGDGYQQIYSFRGAINALDSIPSTKTFYLTQSFRFGPEVAYLASSWMRTMLGEEKKFLIGTDKPSRLDGEGEGQMAVICRSNVTVFNECVAIAEQVEGRRCLSVGTARTPFDFETLEALFYLYLSTKSRDSDTPQRPRRPDHWILRRRDFKSLEDVRIHATKVHDIELLGKVNVVEKHGIHTGQRIQAIKSCLVRDPKLADFVVTTAHKSKGLEFKNVRLAHDMGQTLAGDDKNLIYVAMTRAMNSLILSEEVYSILTNRLGPIFYSPQFPSPDQPLECTRCHQQQPGGQAKFLVRKPISVCHTTGTTIKYNQVRLCKICVSDSIEVNHEEEDFFDYFGPNGENLKQKCFRFYLPFLE